MLEVIFYGVIDIGLIILIIGVFRDINKEKSYVPNLKQWTKLYLSPLLEPEWV